MTSPTPPWARPSRMGSMTLGATPAGSGSGQTTTPRCSRSKRCGVGGSRSAGSPIPRPSGCWSVPMPAGPTATGVRAWKTEQARLADETGLAITVLHLPPGTSKWNRSEHRLFSHISMNWRGRPLESREVIIETISAVTTRTGLRVPAVLDTGIYPTGIKLPDKEMKVFDAAHLHRHPFPGDWNYTIRATSADPATRPDDPK